MTLHTAEGRDVEIIGGKREEEAVLEDVKRGELENPHLVCPHSSLWWIRPVNAAKAIA